MWLLMVTVVRLVCRFVIRRRLRRASLCRWLWRLFRIIWMMVCCCYLVVSLLDRRLRRKLFLLLSRCRRVVCGVWLRLLLLRIGDRGWYRSLACSLLRVVGLLLVRCGLWLVVLTLLGLLMRLLLLVLTWRLLCRVCSRFGL